MAVIISGYIWPNIGVSAVLHTNHELKVQIDLNYVVIYIKVKFIAKCYKFYRKLSCQNDLSPIRQHLVTIPAL